MAHLFVYKEEGRLELLHLKGYEVWDRNLRTVVVKKPLQERDLPVF